MQKIKLVKIGKKNAPTWRIVVAEKTRTGQGKVSDYIGHYHPHMKPKSFEIDMEKFKFWKDRGAQPTDTVIRLIGKFVEKSKDYQKLVSTKIYKSKKPEEEKKNSESGTKVQEDKAEEVVEKKAPAEEVIEAKEEKITETTTEENKEDAKEDVSEEKAE